MNTLEIVKKFTELRKNYQNIDSHDDDGGKFLE